MFHKAQPHWSVCSEELGGDRDGGGNTHEFADEFTH